MQSKVNLPSLIAEMIPLKFEKQEFNLTDLASSIMNLADTLHEDSPAEHRAKEKAKSPAAKALNIPYATDKLIRSDSSQAQFYDLIDLLVKDKVK